MGPLLTDDNTVTSSKPVQHQTPHTRPGPTDTRAGLPCLWPPAGDLSLFGRFLFWVLFFEKTAYCREKAITAGWVAASPSVPPPLRPSAPPMSRKTWLLVPVSHCIYQPGEEA